MRKQNVLCFQHTGGMDIIRKLSCKIPNVCFWNVCCWQRCVFCCVINQLLFGILIPHGAVKQTCHNDDVDISNSCSENQPIDSPTRAQKMSATDANCCFKFTPCCFSQQNSHKQIDQHGETKNRSLKPNNHTTVNPKLWLDSKCF